MEAIWVSISIFLISTAINIGVNFWIGTARAGKLAGLYEERIRNMQEDNRESKRMIEKLNDHVKELLISVGMLQAEMKRLRR